MFNVQTSLENVWQETVISHCHQKAPDAPSGNICTNIKIDSTKINFQGKLFVHLTY